MKLTQEHQLVLDALAALRSEYGADHAFPFKSIQLYVAADRTKIRRWVRHLARKGLARYVRGLFTEDGMVAGSGYQITDTGLLLSRPH